jgi:hypothetical protein
MAGLQFEFAAPKKENHESAKSDNTIMQTSCARHLAKAQWHLTIPVATLSSPEQAPSRSSAEFSAKF